MKSDIVKKGATRCAHRSLFHAMGYGPEDLEKPLIGICNSFNEIIPGHMHLRSIAEAVVHLWNFRPLAFVTVSPWGIPV